jgi:hypothetical protein
MSATSPKAAERLTSRDVRILQIVLQKSKLAGPHVSAAASTKKAGKVRA